MAAYTKRYAGGFVDEPSTASAVDSTFLNAVEAALLNLLTVDGSVDGQVLQWVQASTRFGPAMLLNKNIDADAAIDWTKINSAGQIKDADIAAGAAIQASKIVGLADLSYTEFTAPVACTATTEATANTIVSGSSTAGTTGAIWVEFYAPSIEIDTVNRGQFALKTVNGITTTPRGTFGASIINATALTDGEFPGVMMVRKLTGFFNSVSVRGFVNGGTMTVKAGAGGSGNILPGFLRIWEA